MGIWGRLGNVIKNYLSDNYDRSAGSESGGSSSHRDPDLDAAYEELDDFLRGNKAAGERVRPVPEELKKDFAELDIAPGAPAGECKAAYKKLLKMHHPDRHAGDAEAMKKATEKTARVNAAYRRLENWFKEKN